MNTSTLKFCIVATLLFAAFTVSAQDQKTSDWKIFTGHYIFDDGQYQELTSLSQMGKLNVVYDVATAANGDIYLATNDGLFVYSADKKLNKIKISKNPFAEAYAVEFDSKQNLWIGTSGKLILYRPDGSYVNFTKDEYPGLEIGEVREIVIDKNDGVWVTGHKFMNTKAGAGISHYDGSTWTNYQEGLAKEYVEDLTIDAEGNIWAVMGREDLGVVMYDGSKWNVFTKDNSSLKTPIVRAIAAGADGKVYFGTEMGLSVYDHGKWENVSLTAIYASKFLTRLAGMDQPQIVSLAVDKNGVLWIGTKKEGVIRLNGDSRVNMTVDNSPLTSNSVRRIMIDQFNNKWFLTGFSNENMRDALLGDMNANERIASFQGAVMYNEPDYEKFPGHEVHNFYTQDLPVAVYYEALADASGTVYLSTSESLIKHTATAGWEEVAPATTGTAPTGSIASAFQSISNYGELSQAGDNSLWMIGRDIMHINDGKVDRWKKGDLELGNMVNGLDVDGKGTIWFGNNEGLCQFDGSKATCMNKKSGLPDMRINEVFIDKDGHVWIGLYAGVAVYDGTAWKEYNKKEGGLVGTWCQSIIQRKNGDICVGTSKGVGVTKDQVTFEMITPPSDLAAYIQVTALAEDADGNLLVGTKNDGLLVLMANGQWVKFDAENSGLPHNQVKSIACTADGVWIVTSREERSTIGTSSAPPTGTPDPAADIKKKIYDFDPASAITYFKLQ